jgi:hypothetical protein
LKRIMENFTFLELGLSEDDVQFCRRVGEKGEAPRALELFLHRSLLGPWRCAT